MRSQVYVIPLYTIIINSYNLNKFVVTLWSEQIRLDSANNIRYICHSFLVDACLRCQSDGKQEECIGKSNHNYILYDVD